MTRNNPKERLSALDSAAYSLGRRQMSVKELRDKLLSKGYEPEEIEQALERLEEIGALDDGVYGCMLARHYKLRGWGPGRIKEEMYKRGVPRMYWEEAIESAEGFSEGAYAALVKKLSGRRDPDSLRKAQAFLMRRGFDRDDIHDAVKRLDSENDD